MSLEPEPPPVDREAARRAVSAPATWMVVAAVLATVVALVGAIFYEDFMNAYLGALRDAGTPEKELEPAKTMVRALGGGMRWLSFLLTLGCQVLVIVGALRMKALRTYGLAVAAAVVSILAVCVGCCCVGTPVGIWALVVLMRPHVKAAFEA